MGKFNFAESDKEYLWKQIEEWDFFQDSDNLGELIIVTVPEFDIPELGNWQFQLSLNKDNAKDFEIRSGLSNELLFFPSEDEITIAVYTESWDFVTDFTASPLLS
tara:strand:- start:21 stop:335 length:315 start_codon:yes stop_codon:yes gene_type:complete